MVPGCNPHSSWRVFVYLAFYFQYALADCGNSSNSVTSTISNAADATSVAAACATFIGDIKIDTESTGDLDFNGLVNLTGNMEPDNTYENFTGTQITSLRSDSLTAITGGLRLYTAQSIEEISFPNLQSIGDSLFIGNAGLLKSIDLSSMKTLGTWVRIFNTLSLTDLKLPSNVDAGLTNNGIDITQTALKNLNTFVSAPGGLSFYDNKFENITSYISTTTAVTWDSTLSDGTGAIVADRNADSVSVYLPNLSTTVGRIELDNCAALSIPALYSINGSFIMQNATFSSLQAPNLGIIHGALNITGSFTGLSAFPALSRIDGDVFIQSTQEIDCDPFRQLSADGKIGGTTFFCQSGSSPPTNVTTSSSPSASSSSNSLSTGAKAGIGVGVALGAILVLGGALTFCIRKRRQKQVSTIGGSGQLSDTKGSMSESGVPKELDGDRPLAEAHGSEVMKRPHELAS